MAKGVVSDEIEIDAMVGNGPLPIGSPIEGLKLVLYADFTRYGSKRAFRERAIETSFSLKYRCLLGGFSFEIETKIPNQEGTAHLLDTRTGFEIYWSRKLIRIARSNERYGAVVSSRVS